MRRRVVNKRVSWARGLLIDSKHERFDEKEAAQVARLSLFLSLALHGRPAVRYSF